MKRMAQTITIFLIGFCISAVWADMSEAQNLIHVGSYDSLGNARAVVTRGNYAFVADQSMGMVIFYCTDTTAPSMVGIFHPTMGQWAYDIDVKGDTAYLAAGTSEPYMGTLYIVDVTNKQQPYLLGSIGFNWEAMKVEVANYAYVAVGGIVYIVDITDPANPFEAGSFNVFAADLYKGDYLFVAARDNGLIIYNDEDPQNIRIIGTCDTPGQALGVSLRRGRNNYVYIADGESELQVINIGNPASPFIAGTIQTAARATSVVGGLYFVYAAIEDSGIVEIMVSDPEHPTLIGWADTPGRAQDIDLDRVIAVASGESLDIFRIRRSSCQYILGDINGNGRFNGIDITFAVSYFKGGVLPPVGPCSCPPHPDFYVQGDLNGSCQFNGIDITFAVNYFGGNLIELRPCPDCPPEY